MTTPLPRLAASFALLCGAAWTLDFIVIAVHNGPYDTLDDACWMIGLAAFAVATVLAGIAASAGRPTLHRVGIVLAAVVAAVLLFTLLQAVLNAAFKHAGNRALRDELSMLAMALLYATAGALALRRRVAMTLAG